MIEEIVSNIDELSQKASTMKVSKNDFLDVLRNITRQKILDIKHANKLFKTRIEKMMRAQNYEIKN